MRIAFVVAERPGETPLIADVLAGLGEVTTIRMPQGRLGIADDGVLGRFLAEPFDLWVFWQTEAVAARLVPFGLRGAVIVPSATPRPDAFWHQFVASRFAVFSWAMHRKLQALEARTALFEWWPEPAAASGAGKTAFFHERRPLDVPNVTTVAQQCAALGIAQLHVHAAPDDSGDGGVGYDGLDTLGGVALTSSTGATPAAEVEAIAAAARFVFAPVREAGIGGAHLWAMARGKVVVGPDLAPLNEAVGHLASGILYDPERPLTLPTLTEARAAELGAAARQRVVEGRRDWDDDFSRLLSYLRGDGERWPAGDFSAGFLRAVQRGVRRRLGDDKADKGTAA